jgi:hypothetical protein
MFGVAMAMRTFVGDSGKSTKDFCFEIFLEPPAQHEATPSLGGNKVSLT